ncbi:MAG: XTP/dITP diphosphatase [Thermoplasmata archaeon]|nr:XTP/dITP diphosphatase [Thermoplasmata archaeon]
MKGKLYLITGNPGKLKEIKNRLDVLNVELGTLQEEFVEVQADTLEEVVLFGIEHLVGEKGIDLPFIKADSGLFIDSLDGFPGVYSAYVQDTIGNDGILKLMEGLDDRTATFKTVMGLHIPGEGVSLFRGEIRGEITLEKKGFFGFGYDPVFIPEGAEKTFAEMTIEEKNRDSHRIRATMKLVDHLSRE